MSLSEVIKILDVFGCQPRRSGKAWTARCPVHDDQTLSIDVGNDGRVLMQCQAGCSTEDIVCALDLEERDLLPGLDCGDLEERGLLPDVGLDDIEQPYPTTEEANQDKIDVPRWEDLGTAVVGVRRYATKEVWLLADGTKYVIGYPKDPPWLRPILKKQRLVDLIERMGGAATVREILRTRLFRKAKKAKAALDDLVEAGVGVWETTAGGRPTRIFRLAKKEGGKCSAARRE